jgi:protein-S-isoprenylcysteine O-methyltransferase Ste14
MPGERWVPLIGVGLSATVWCFLHSWLLVPGIKERLRARLGRRAELERPLYVIFSVVTLLPLLLWWRSLPQRVLFAWPGAWQIVRWVGLFLAGVMFAAGLRVHDNRELLGLRALQRLRSGRPPPPPRLRRDGILARARHPYYAGTLLLLICLGPDSDVNLVWRLVFLLYTYLGTRLEERKLRATFGEEYRRYEREVPRYLPRIW